MVENVEMSGRVFGGWTVISRGNKPTHWLCRCVCGAERHVAGPALRFGKSTGCGCVRDKAFSARLTVHGYARAPEYMAWRHMRQRCSNPNDRGFINYGGRGIRVCPRWEEFANFLEDMGRRPSDGHSIERVDVDGDYEPSNCIWATVIVQLRNRRNTRYVKIGERVGKLADLAEEMGLPYEVLRYRARYRKGAEFVDRPL